MCFEGLFESLVCLIGVLLIGCSDAGRLHYDHLVTKRTLARDDGAYPKLGDQFRSLRHALIMPYPGRADVVNQSTLPQALVAVSGDYRKVADTGRTEDAAVAFNF